MINTERMRQAREAKGLSQAQLARAVGVSQGLIWAIENGRKTPSLEVFVRLCAALSLPLEALVKVPKQPCKEFRLSPATERRLRELAARLRKESARIRECLRYLPKVSFPQLGSSEVMAHE